MLFAVVECVVGVWLRVCGRVWVPVGARHRMFHVKQFEDDGRFEPRRGRVNGLEPVLRRLLGWCAVLLVLPAERVVRLLGME